MEPEKIEVTASDPSATRQSSSTSSVPELEESLQVVEALNRVRRSVSSDDQGTGHNLERSLARLVSERLERLDLLQSDNRPTVIRRTSTPILNPNSLFVPPENLSVSAPNHHYPPDPDLPFTDILESFLPCPTTTPLNLSPEREPSSVFDVSDLHPLNDFSNCSSLLTDFLSPSPTKTSNCPLSASQSAPGAPIVPLLISITGTMEAAEGNCLRLDRKFDRFLRKYKPEDLHKDLVRMCSGMADHMRELNAVYDDLVEAIDEMTVERSETFGTGKVREWSTKLEEVEARMKK